jgi:hypothetical protein
MIIFLDFDGVLHPDAVFRPRNKPIELRAEGELMMHAHHLTKILSKYPEIKIVLSTSWVRELGFDRTLKKMPADLASRVIGATWHKHMRANGKENDPFNWLNRFQQIHRHVIRNGVKNWLAIDDLHSGTEDWPQEFAQHLVQTDAEKGLGCTEKQQELKRKLE